MDFFDFFLSTIVFMVALTGFIQASYPCKMVVVVPVANLVDTPGFDNHARRGASCSRNVPHLQTQLLCNEQVLALKEVIVDDKKWVRVQAQEQKKVHFDEEKGLVISHYPGWMRAQDLRGIVEDSDRQQDCVVSSLYKIMYNRNIQPILPFGVKISLERQSASGFYDTKLLDGKQGIIPDGTTRVIERNSFAQIPNLTDIKGNLALQTQLRNAVVAYARLFLGMPYVWGGSSMYQADAGHLTGVDCSALMYLSYRACGFEIPRDAQDQFLVTHPVNSAQMQLGDLIFFGKERECNGKKVIRMNHVLMYAGQGMLIEAWGDGQVDADQCAHKNFLCVREIAVDKRLGKALDEFIDGEFIEDQNLFVYFRKAFFDI